MHNKMPKYSQTLILAIIFCITITSVLHNCIYLINPAYIQKNNISKIIQMWNTWKSMIILQERSFKNCKKLTSAYQESWTWGSNSDKLLSSYYSH